MSIIRPPSVARRVVVRQDPAQVVVRLDSGEVIAPQPTSKEIVTKDDQRVGVFVREQRAVQVNVPGLQGPTGAPGGSFLEFTQPTPATTWTINHNFGYRPVVELFSVGGMEMWADVTHTSVNQVVVQFNSPTAGAARLI